MIVTESGPHTTKMLTALDTCSYPPRNVVLILNWTYLMESVPEMSMVVHRGLPPHFEENVAAPLLANEFL